MEEVKQWEGISFRRHLIKCSRPGDLASGVCVPLYVLCVMHIYMTVQWIKK
jgi:hypothetical protein